MDLTLGEGKRMLDVLIVGGGPAGMAASIWCKRLGLRSLLLEGRKELGGQLFAIHNPIVDYPGIVVRSGRELVPHFLAHLQELGCTYRCNAKVTGIDVARKTVYTADETLSAHSLILAMGSRERRLGVPGEQEMRARGEIYSASRDYQKFRGKRVAVVGGGDRAFEGALLLADTGAQVELIHRSSLFRARPEFRERAWAHPNIRIHTDTVVTRILGESHVQAVGMTSPSQHHEEIVSVDAVFVRIGVEANDELVRGQVQCDADGYILTNADGETSAKDVYAVGDLCVRPSYSSISLSVGQAARAVKKISAKIFGLPI
jgi:thioredoxin reductase (NADPH)